MYKLEVRILGKVVAVQTCSGGAIPVKASKFGRLFDTSGFDTVAIRFGFDIKSSF